MSLRTVIKQNALLCLLLFAMLGGLASVATTASQVGPETPHASVTTQRDAPPAAASVEMSENQPVQAVAPLPDSASAKVSASLKLACDQIAKAAATKAYRTASANENARHKHVLFVIRGTGVVARVLSPSNYMARLDQEVAEHKQIVADLRRTYQHQLALAHCS